MVLEIDCHQLAFVLSWIVLLESLKQGLVGWLSRGVQRLLGGKSFQQFMEIMAKKKALEREKDKYYSVDDFPKKAKLDRKLIQLELEEETLSLSSYVRYGVPIFFPIVLKTLSYSIYLSLVLIYRNVPILTYPQTTWLPRFVAMVVGLPTGVEGGVGCVYVILVVKICYSYLLSRLIETGLRSGRDKTE